MAHLAASRRRNGLGKNEELLAASRAAAVSDWCDSHVKEATFQKQKKVAKRIKAFRAGHLLPSEVTTKLKRRAKEAETQQNKRRRTYDLEQAKKMQAL